MNKLIRISIFMFIISIIFTACKKDTELQVQQNVDPTEQKILNFIEKMESENKSGESMSVEDAVWYIEAALNYTNCIVPEDIINLGVSFDSELESVLYDIEIENDVISLDVITDFYNTITEDMLNIKDNYEYDIKFVNTADIEIADGILSAKFFIRFTNIDKSLWSISDNWYWGFDLGNCSLSVEGRDLTDEVEKWISHNRAAPYNVYYTDIVWEGIFVYYPDDELQDIDLCSVCYNLKDEGVDVFHATTETYDPNYTSFAYYCVEEVSGNYNAYETNRGLDIIEDDYADPGRDVTSWDVMEHINQEDAGSTGPAPWKFWISHRMYVYSGIPHEFGQNQ